MRILTLIGLFILGIVPFIIEAQEITDKKNYKKALAYFNNEQYSMALPLFLKVDSAGPPSFEVRYYIGACYLNTSNEQPRGIPYLEYAQKHGENLLPGAVFADLGRLYHLNYQFENAVDQFEKYLNLSGKKDYDEGYVMRMIEICRYAGTILKDSLDVEIITAGQPVNTEISEIMPCVTADESLLFFTRLKITRYKGLDIDTSSVICVSEKKNGRWSAPSEIALPNGFGSTRLQLTGVSPDGQWLFLTAKTTQTGYDLYKARYQNNQLDEMIPFPAPVNSPYDEKSCSVTPDGQTLYFSSNRPGGYGHHDIYISHKEENDNWSPPVNAGPAVNSPFPEIHPYIHPDQRTLFFASEGHQTMGGFDIFTSVYDPVTQQWTGAKNAGYPVNTTYSDVSFVVTADGNNAYFSSARGNASGFHDIYKALLHQNIPLTLVKGTITGGIPAKPVSARIRVIDKESGQKLKYIYNPNPETGKYLMIFPPDKNYEMIIEAEGYYPSTIGIFVPGQNYFYELFQEIHLDKVKMSDQKELGQEVTVRNVFSDINRNPDDTLFRFRDTLADQRYEKLLSIVEGIIETTDSIGQQRLERFSEEYISDQNHQDKNLDNLLNLIDQAIESTDSSMLSILDQTAIYQERTRKVYFYDAENHKPELTFIMLDGDTVWTLPALDTRKDQILTPEATTQTEKIKPNERPHDWEKMTVKKKIHTLNVYFEPGKSQISPACHTAFSDFVRLMLDNSNLVLEIDGYSDTRGEESVNLDLSKDRAQNVLRYFLDNYIPTQRIRINGYGESRFQLEKNDQERKENRRAEVNLYEVSY